MVRLGNFKKLEVIGNEGDIATWGDEEEIASVFLSVSYTHLTLPTIYSV